MEITKMNLFKKLQDRKKCLLLTFIAFSTFANAQLVTYPEGLKTGMQHNDDYTVRVRVPGGEWKDLFEYNVSVDMDNVQSASMVQFDMGSPVEVMVKKNNGLIQDVQIRPLENKIRHTVNQNTILFTLEKPRYLSVEFNGDRLHNLHLFANPLETETYSESSAGVMYFGPGIHRPQDVPNNQIRIPSNTTVYLAPGAVVKAKLLVDKAENVRIIGRGILDHPLRGIEVTYSKNVLVDGITIVNPDHYTVFGGETTGLTIKNLKSFSCKGWSDGIDLMCCNEVLIDNVFMRNSDDCIAVYAHRWNYYGGSKNITLQNSILWADIAHPVNIGGHGNPADEVPVVGHKENRSREGPQHLLQGLLAHDVHVVGRLVQDQQVGPGLEHLAQGQPHPLAAGELPHLLLHVLPGEQEAPQGPADLLPLELRVFLPEIVQDCLFRIHMVRHRRLLVEISPLHVGAEGECAAQGRHGACQGL